MKNLESDIKEKNFKNIYLFYGDEEYLKKEYEYKFRKSIIPDGMDIMNFNVYEGNKININDLIDNSEMLPFMNDYRLIIIRKSDLFIKIKKDDYNKLNKYMQDILKSTILIFIENKIDKRNSLFKTVNKLGYVCEFNTPKENKLAQWIENIVLKSGKSISNSTVIYFIRNVGGNMETLKNEVDKLIDFSTGNTITIEDVNNICTKSIESQIFELVSFIGNKKVEKAINIYNNMLIQKQQPIVILSMIARQFRLIMQSKYLYKRNSYTPEQIAYEISSREFMVKRYISQSYNFTVKGLINAIEECLETDIKIKTGQINDKIAVEMIIIKYAS